VRKFFLAFLHVFFGLKPRDIEEIKSRVKPLNPKKGKELSKDIKDKDENKYDEKKDVDEEEDEGKREEMDVEDEDKDADMPTKHKDGGKDGERVLGGVERGLGGVGRRTRRSSRGEKEDEGRDGDDTMHTDDDEEEEDEEEEEEEDLWQAVHALLEFRPLTSFESTDKVAASEKWYVSSSRLLLLLNRSLSGSLLTPLSITQIWGSTALFLLSRSPLLLRRSLSRSLLTPWSIPQAFHDVDRHDERLLWQPSMLCFFPALSEAVRATA